MADYLPGECIINEALIEDGSSELLTVAQRHALGQTDNGQVILTEGDAAWVLAIPSKDNGGPVFMAGGTDAVIRMEPGVPYQLGAIKRFTTWTAWGDEYAAAPNQYKLTLVVGIPL